MSPVTTKEHNRPMLVAHLKRIAKLPRHNLTGPKRCEICRRVYASARLHSRTCSPACRKLRWRRNQAALQTTPALDFKPLPLHPAPTA